MVVGVGHCVGMTGGHVGDGTLDGPAVSGADGVGRGIGDDDATGGG
jgi:hypothetical protein